MKFLHAVGPIAISIAVWPQLIAENERKIWHIVPSLWQTTVLRKGFEIENSIALKMLVFIATSSLMIKVSKQRFLKISKIFLKKWLEKPSSGIKLREI